MLGRALVENEVPGIVDDLVILVGSPVRDEHKRIIGGLFASIESGREFTRLLRLGRAGERGENYAFGLKGQVLAGSNGDPSARVNDRGYAIGYDAAIGDHLIVGASGGDTSPEVELTAVSDNSTSQMRHVGVYGRYARNASRLSVIGGGSHVESKTARWITDGFALSSAHAQYDGGTLFSRVEYGYAFPLGEIGRASCRERVL